MTPKVILWLPHNTGTYMHMHTNIFTHTIHREMELGRICL